MATVAARSAEAMPLIVAIAVDTDYSPMLIGVRNGATTAGDISVVNHRGDTVVVKNVQPGETIRGQFQRVNNTGTTVGTPATYLTGLQ